MRLSDAFTEHCVACGDHAPRLLKRTAMQVARDGYRGFMAGRRLVVPGLPNKVVVSLLRVVPRGNVLALTDGNCVAATGDRLAEGASKKLARSAGAGKAVTRRPMQWCCRSTRSRRSRRSTAPSRGCR
jgi:hypothetical protein